MAARPGSRTGWRPRTSEGSLASRTVVRYGSGLDSSKFAVIRLS